MRIYKLLNEVVITKEFEDFEFKNDDVKTKKIVKETIIKDSLTLLKTIKRDINVDDYDDVIYELEEFYCCKFDDIYINDNVIDRIKEILEL